MANVPQWLTIITLQRSRSSILVPIDFAYMPTAVNSNFCSRTHRLATIHNATDDDNDDRRTQHCSMSATVSTVSTKSAAVLHDLNQNSELAK